MLHKYVFTEHQVIAPFLVLRIINGPRNRLSTKLKEEKTFFSGSSVNSSVAKSSVVKISKTRIHSSRMCTVHTFFHDRDPLDRDPGPVDRDPRPVNRQTPVKT